MVEPIFPGDGIVRKADVKEDGYSQTAEQYISKGKVALFLYTQSIVDEQGIYHNALFQHVDEDPFFDILLRKIKQYEDMSRLTSLRGVRPGEA